MRVRPYLYCTEFIKMRRALDFGSEQPNFLSIKNAYFLMDGLTFTHVYKISSNHVAERGVGCSFSST